MGLLVVDNQKPGVELDDRLLAHLKVVVFAKFRRHESFGFSWDHASASGGRTSIWFHESIPVKFVFFGGSAPDLNRAWIDELMIAANGASGLQLTKEPPEHQGP